MAHILFSLCLISCFFWAEGAEATQVDLVDRIVNGEDAANTSHPYMVSLVQNYAGGNENENGGENGMNGGDSDDGRDWYYYYYGNDGEGGGDGYYYYNDDKDGTEIGKRSKLSARVPKPWLLGGNGNGHGHGNGNRPDPGYGHGKPNIKPTAQPANNTENVTQTAVRPDNPWQGQRPGNAQRPWFMQARGNSKHRMRQHNRRRVKAQTQSPHFCGGALIAPQWVLTAGHCVGKGEQGSTVADPADISVKIAEYDLSIEHETNEEKIDLTKIIRHPSYNPQTTENDIALLKLSKSVDISKENIATLALPSRALIVGETCTIVGWGTTQAGQQGSGLPNILQEAEVQVISQDVCANAYSDIKDSMVCASNATLGIDSCQGDSGGPMINMEDGKQVLSGIVSYGIGCAQPDYPGVYTRVKNFTTWITQTMQANP